MHGKLVPLMLSTIEKDKEDDIVAANAENIFRWKEIGDKYLKENFDENKERLELYEWKKEEIQMHSENFGI